MSQAARNEIQEKELKSLDMKQQETYRHLVAYGKDHCEALRLAQGPDEELPWNKGRPVYGFGQTGSGRHLGWC